MVSALEKAGKKVVWHSGDFFSANPPKLFKSICTNPPFSQATKFLIRSIEMVRPELGKIAMLLPVTFDTAKGRVPLFDSYPFKAKYTLTQRIRWANLEQKKNGPSTNHAWYVWDWGGDQKSKPIMGWL